jgi:hypothetical protein
MASDSSKPAKDVLATLPAAADVRRQITENLRERQLLRRMLKLSEQREHLAALDKEGQRHE